MTVSANIWQARAAMCELLALSFPLPGGQGARRGHRLRGGGAGRRRDRQRARDRLDGRGPVPAEAAALPDPDDIPEGLRPRLRACSWAPEAVVQPVRGRVACEKARGVQPLLFVNHALHGCGALLRPADWAVPEGANEALGRRCGPSWASGIPGPARGGRRHGRSEPEADVGSWRRRRAHRSRPRSTRRSATRLTNSTRGTTVPSPATWWPRPVARQLSEAAWDGFMAEHSKVWMPQFAGPARRIPRAVLQTGRQPAWRPHQVASARLRASVSSRGSLCGLPSFCEGRLGGG